MSNLTINLKEDIKSLTEFKRKTPELSEQLKKNHRPMILTNNGEADMVVMDTETYQTLLDAYERQEARRMIHQARREILEGKGRPADEVFERILNKLGK